MPHPHYIRMGQTHFAVVLYSVPTVPPSAGQMASPLCLLRFSSRARGSCQAKYSSRNWCTTSERSFPLTSAPSTSNDSERYPKGRTHKPPAPSLQHFRTIVLIKYNLNIAYAFPSCQILMAFKIFDQCDKFGERTLKGTGSDSK